ncbi:MAG: hypothetical protein ACOC6K_04485 [Thermodesulfobacteriota bacterium]
MMDHTRPACPIPYVGRCLYARCNFWDEERRECSGLYFEDHEAWKEVTSPQPHSPCTIHWTEDFD